MDFIFNTYFLAQIIGLVGYGFYMSAPYFKKRIQILNIELIGCIVLCAHWYFMDIPVMFWATIIWVYMIIASIFREYSKSANILISLAYIMVLVNSYLHWDNRIIDYTSFMGITLAITSRYFIDLLKFRSIAFLGGNFSVISCICSMSPAAILFNSVFTLGHAKGVIHILSERGLSITPLNLTLKPIPIKTNRIP